MSTGPPASPSPVSGTPMRRPGSMSCRSASRAPIPAAPGPPRRSSASPATSWRDSTSEGPFDGVLMAQHGAMVVEGYPDADAEFIRRTRAVVGPRVPIGNVMDTHGNVSPAQVHAADITLLWRTNPHMDCRDRGYQLAQLIAQTVRGEVEPVQAIVNPPMGANILAQNTADDPMRSLLREALEMTEATPGLLDQSIGEGFPYADVPHMGMALVAVADKDVSIAETRRPRDGRANVGAARGIRSARRLGRRCGPARARRCNGADRPARRRRQHGRGHARRLDVHPRGPARRRPLGIPADRPRPGRGRRVRDGRRRKPRGAHGRGQVRRPARDPAADRRPGAGPVGRQVQGI